MAERTIQIADKPTVDEILALLENAEVGLAALKLLLGDSADAASMNAVKGILENGTYGLSALDKDLGTITNYLTNGAYGLNALKNAVTGRANETTVAAVKALLENGTYGLNALKTAIENANKFNSTSAGTLQINSAYTRLGDAQTLGTGSSSSIVYAAYSPELSITGNGQITFYNTNKKYQGLDNGLIKPVDMVIDGCAVPISKVNSGGALTLFYNNAGADTTYHLKNFEFGKSFKCRLGCFGTKSASSTVSAGCNASADYFIQLR